MRALLGLVVCCGSAFVADRSPAEAATIAREIHASGLLFDGYNDLPWQVRQLGGGSFDKLEIAQSLPKLHTDLPKLKASGS